MIASLVSNQLIPVQMRWWDFLLNPPKRCIWPDLLLFLHTNEPLLCERLDRLIDQCDPATPSCCEKTSLFYSRFYAMKIVVSSRQIGLPLAFRRKFTLGA